MATEKKDIRAYSLTELQDFFVANGDKALGENKSINGCGIRESINLMG